MNHNDHDVLLGKLKDKSAVIGIIGMGYVGLPLVIRYAEVGYKVLGFDIDKTKVDALNQGRSYIKHIASDSIRLAKERGFEATTEFKRASEPDALIICVPTPLNKYREPDISFITNTMDAIAPYIRAQQVISLESTTYPGTTDEELLPRIEKRGFKVGENIYLVFSPEREDPGNPKYSAGNTPKICGGVTQKCIEAGLMLYGQAIEKVVPVSSTRAAEMTKLLENIHRAVNIGLVNEMKIVCDRMDIDIYEVIRAASTKPFGFTPYYPGPGLGGHCIPIDPFYLTWKAREFGVHTKFIELAGEINSSMPEYVVTKTLEAMNERQKTLKGSKVLVLGLAYKKNIDDNRESPSVEIMKMLMAKGANVEYSDPFIPTFRKMRRHDYHLESVPINAKTIASFDAVVLVTDHDAFDYDLIQKHSALIVDTRGRYPAKLENVVKA